MSHRLLRIAFPSKISQYTKVVRFSSSLGRNMSVPTAANDASSTPPPNTRRAASWDIRGWQNNWNWKPQPDEDIIEYQTRFPIKNTALVYKGADPAAPLLATIQVKDTFDAEITFPNKESGDIATRNPILMENIAQGGFTTRWPVKVRALGDRELQWEYEHPAFGDNPMYLKDPVTGEILGDANDNCLTLNSELPEEAVKELVITGTAAQVLLVHLMGNDMKIAAQGPEGRSQWKYQEPDWWDNEEPEEDENNGEN
ncbi:hypothetical protein F5884DRAFT_509028 [Xylogone sp. PMI_703]|nr:hypothetical protein F5884DRAFT_509028 [Xylogone sp. PMI_703]